MHVMNRFLARACAVAAAGVALSTVVVTAASASGGGGVPIHLGALGPAGLAAPTSNRYWAGYQATVTAGSATVAAASFTVPALACTTADRAIGPDTVVWVNNYKALSGAFVFTGCVNGTAVYYPDLVSNGKSTSFASTPFAAGDVIDLTTKVSTNRTRVVVTDVTTGVTVQHLGVGASADAAFIGDDAWGSSTGTEQGVPNFGKLTFTNCLIDGTALSGWHAHAYQRVNSGGTVQIATGGFWPGGTAFTTHYQHS